MAKTANNSTRSSTPSAAHHGNNASGPVVNGNGRVQSLPNNYKFDKPEGGGATKNGITEGRLQQQQQQQQNGERHDITEGSSHTNNETRTQQQRQQHEEHKNTKEQTMTRAVRVHSHTHVIVQGDPTRTSTHDGDAPLVNSSKKKRRKPRPIKMIKKFNQRRRERSHGDSSVGSDYTNATATQQQPQRRQHQRPQNDDAPVPLIARAKKNLSRDDLPATLATLRSQIETETKTLRNDLENLINHRARINIVHDRVSSLHSRTTDALLSVDTLTLKATRLRRAFEMELLSLEREELNLADCEQCLGAAENERDMLAREIARYEREIDRKARAIGEAKRRLEEVGKRMAPKDVYYDAWEVMPSKRKEPCGALVSPSPSDDEGDSVPSDVSAITETQPRASLSSEQQCRMFMRIGDLSTGISSPKLFSMDDAQTPLVVSKLIDYAMALTTDEGSRWTPTKDTERVLSKKTKGDFSGGWNDAAGTEVFVWSTKFDHGGYGSDYPAVKARGNVKCAPRELLELLRDSARTKEYNKMSMSRTDEFFFQRGIDVKGGRFGDGEAKIIRSLNKIPMMKKPMELLSFILLKPVEKYNGYVTVTRSVCENEDGVIESGETMRSEMLLSVNLLRGVDDYTELTTVTNVYSPGVPLMIGKRIGLNSALNFIKDIQSIWS
eukprot:CAMPEP_0172482960 /NCGR_PEP_ID=MMETSP1066-20121228/9710_1 /TAXON_ID=671091 /ORGANISM="Coscinodiscus wailesii, Strain CCMP2513" /LENGTH=666 /DNA_ID=CAMNT_0013246543 /DNA_START=81 /DNA_END=2081 /DNA_ORIENTATION=-